MARSRRDWLRSIGASAAGCLAAPAVWGVEGARESSAAAAHGPLTITGMTVTPVALPDPPILASSGCHGPYFIRNIVEIETDAGIVGLGETKGGEDRREALERAREHVVGKNAFAYRAFAADVSELDPAAYAGIELACLDACGKATGRRVCELLGGPVREEVEFAAYLFYRYAADHPVLIADPRIVDGRGRGDKALDDWGEVRTPEAMADMAARFHDQWGFRVFKLKAGVLTPEEELRTLQLMNDRFEGKFLLRIDPNARWTVKTAVRIGKAMRGLPLEYYEDPVPGQRDMAKVRQATGWMMSTNMCVTEFEHVPDAVRLQPVDVVLGDLHGWGGMAAFLELGRICETFGWRLSQHSNNHAGITMAAMIHVGATAPQLTCASDTHYVWLPDDADVIDGPKLPIAGGKMAVPAGPGLGVILNRDKLARAHEVWQNCGMKERDDEGTMQLLFPAWQRQRF